MPDDRVGWFYHGVAYCECVTMKGDSISLQLDFASATGSENVCDVNAQGQKNGYMVSTFSLPDSPLKGGSAAVYTCPGAPEQASRGGRAGGLRSVRGRPTPAGVGIAVPRSQRGANAVAAARREPPPVRRAGRGRSGAPGRSPGARSLAALDGATRVPFD